jgi:hypothetical protein
MNTPQIPIEELLDTIIFEESAPTYEALLKWCERYPAHRDELAKFFATWGVQENISQEVEIDDDRLANLAVSHALNLVGTRDQEQRDESTHTRVEVSRPSSARPIGIRLAQPSASLTPLPAMRSAKASRSTSHNVQFDEAVMIAVLSGRFGSERFPLGRFRRTKFSYLLYRRMRRAPSGFMKKAAGPYSPRTRYGGAEKIALNSGYVLEHTTGKGEGFVAGPNIAQAESYFEKWYGLDVFIWLEQFRKKTNDELELLTTVDMAIVELDREGKAVTLVTVKQVIRDSAEWKAKLDRAVFADNRIAGTIESCRQLFPAEQ